MNTFEHLRPVDTIEFIRVVLCTPFLLQLGVEGIRAHLELMYNKLRDMADVLDGEAKKKVVFRRLLVP